MANKNNLDSSSILNSSQLWARYIAYWPLYLILALIFVLVSTLYIKFRVPEYQITARVLIKDEKKGVSDSKGYESLNLISTNKIIDNEVEVIQARTIIDKVVKNLFLYAPVYRERKVFSAPAYAVSPIKIEAKNPDSIKPVKKVAFVYNKQSQKVTVNKKEYPINQWLSTDFGIVRFVINNSGSDSSTQEKLFFSLIDPKTVTESIQGSLKAETVTKPSSIISLTFKDKDRKRGEDIVNEIIRLYEASQVEDKNALAKTTASFIEERLVHVAADLDSIQKRLQNYKKRNNAVQITDQGGFYIKNVTENDQKLGELNIQLAVLDQVQSYVQSKNNRGAMVPSTIGVENPFLSQLLQNLNDKELQYENLKKTVAENNPILTSVADQIQSLRTSITENIENQRKNLISSKNSLIATNNSFTSTLQGLPEKERELVEISRQADVLNKIYSYLLEKREESALTYVSTVADSKPIDMARASVSPIGPKPIIIYLVSIIAALVLGIGVITARETFNGNILYRREIEAATSFPVLSEITYKNIQDPVAIESKQNPILIEQFRRLRTSLYHLQNHPKIKKVLVTSSISGEGKSFIAKNLAASLAGTGKKVLLLDFNVTFPTVTTELVMEDGVGVTNYLLGECSFDEIIQRTQTNENLFIAPAGAFINNFSEVLVNGRLQELFTSLEVIFDYLIVDTPAVEISTDAYILSEYCDATLYVVRQNYTPKFFVHRLDETNKINTLKNIAIVFNAIHTRGFAKNGYGSGYGYSFTEDYRKLLTNRRVQKRKLIGLPKVNND